MKVSLFKYLSGTWDEAKGMLHEDLEHFEIAFNRLSGKLLDGDNKLVASSIDGDPTASTPLYVTNEGIDGSGTADYSPKWGLVDLIAGVKNRLQFLHFIRATAASVLVGRGAASGAGDFQQITLGTGLSMTGTVLSATSGAGTVTHTAGALTVNQLVIGNAADDEKVLGTLGTTTTVLHGNAAGAPTFAAVSLTADVSGDLPLANLVPSAAASKLLGRESGSAGDWEPITLGTNLTMTGSTLDATAGGTGTVTHTAGALTANQLVIGNGTDDEKVLGSLGTTTTVLHGNAAGAPTFGAVSLTTDVSGDLPLANLAPSAAASKLLGRESGSAGDWEPITLGTNLTITGTTLDASAGITQLTGDVTAGPGSGSQAAALAASGVAAATYGSASSVAQFTVDAKGRVTAASNVTISTGGAGTGGPDLTGTVNPQGVQTADPGQMYRDTITGYLYRKMVGSGNTGWYYVPAPTGAGGGIGPQVAYLLANSASDGVPTGLGGFDNIAQTNNSGPVAFDSTWYSKSITNSSAGVRGGWYTGLTPFWWDNDFDLTVTVRTHTTFTDGRLYVGLTSADLTNSDTLPGNGFAFRYSDGTDSGWMGVTRDGVTQSLTAQVAAIATSTRYRLRIRFIRSGTPTAYFSVNDGTEISKTTNIPATGVASGVFLYVYNKNATTQNLLFKHAGMTYGA